MEAMNQTSKRCKNRMEMEIFGKQECRDKYTTGEKRYQYLLKLEQALTMETSGVMRG
jgi:hypothetical protein